MRRRPSFVEQHYYRFNYPVETKEDVADTLQEFFETSHLSRQIVERWKIGHKWLSTDPPFRSTAHWLTEEHVAQMVSDGDVFIAGATAYEEQLVGLPTDVDLTNHPATPAVVEAMQMMASALRGAEDDIYRDGVHPIRGRIREMVRLTQLLDRSLYGIENWHLLPAGI